MKTHRTLIPSLLVVGLLGLAACGKDVDRSTRPISNPYAVQTLPTNPGIQPGVYPAPRGPQVQVGTEVGAGIQLRARFGLSAKIGYSFRNLFGKKTEIRSGSCSSSSHVSSSRSSQSCDFVEKLDLARQFEMDLLCNARCEFVAVGSRVCLECRGYSSKKRSRDKRVKLQVRELKKFIQGAEVVLQSYRSHLTETDRADLEVKVELAEIKVSQLLSSNTSEDPETCIGDLPYTPVPVERTPAPAPEHDDDGSDELQADLSEIITLEVGSLRSIGCDYDGVKFDCEPKVNHFKKNQAKKKDGSFFSSSDMAQVERQISGLSALIINIDEFIESYESNPLLSSEEKDKLLSLKEAARVALNQRLEEFPEFNHLAR